MPIRLLSLTLTSVVILVACAGSENQPTVLRLVDLFPSASVIGTGGTGGTGAAGAPPEPTEWRFEEGHDVGWKAGAGVSGLRVDGNVLAGRSITNVPIVYVERHSGLDDPDVLHQVIVRARVSEGANLTVTFRRSESLNLERTCRDRRRVSVAPVDTAHSRRRPSDLLDQCRLGGPGIVSSLRNPPHFAATD